MESIESYRRLAFDALFKGQSFAKSWPVWAPELHAASSGFRDPYAVLQLGCELSRIFTLTGEPGREQSTVSSAGASWEALVCWYLNVVLSGTNGIALRQSKALVPRVVNDALTVNYSNIQTNTESDIIVVAFPAEFDFSPALRGNHQEFSAAARKQISGIEAHVVQCKTNWNDNAQIPMLWDMIYKARGFKSSSLSIGRDGVSVDDLKAFSYAFVTVPSQKEDKIPKAGAIAVNRVRHLSGGNYWGKPTKSGVARGLHEYFKHNLAGLFPSAIEQSIGRAMETRAGWFGDPRNTGLPAEAG